jgi:hypothetical protein
VVGAEDGISGRDASLSQREVRDVVHHVSRVEQEPAQ